MKPKTRGNRVYSLILGTLSDICVALPLDYIGCSRAKVLLLAKHSYCL